MGSERIQQTESVDFSDNKRKTTHDKAGKRTSTSTSTTTHIEMGNYWFQTVATHALVKTTTHRHTAPLTLLWKTTSQVVSKMSSSMSSLVFSRTKEQHLEEVETSVSKLRTTQLYIQNNIEAIKLKMTAFQTAAEKAWSEGQRSETLAKLRLKKMYEQELSKLHSLDFSVETHILHLESVLVMIQTVDVLKSTSSDAERANRSIDAEKLDDALENILNQRDHHEDIESVIASFDSSTTSLADDDELLAELLAPASDDGTSTGQQAQQRLLQQAHERLQQQSANGQQQHINNRRQPDLLPLPRPPQQEIQRRHTTCYDSSDNEEALSIEC